MPNLPEKYQRKTEYLPYLNKPSKHDGECSEASKDDDGSQNIVPTNTPITKEEVNEA